MGTWRPQVLSGGLPRSQAEPVLRTRSGDGVQQAETAHESAKWSNRGREGCECEGKLDGVGWLKSGIGSERGVAVAGGQVL